jgi:hypothetical protein
VDVGDAVEAIDVPLVWQNSAIVKADVELPLGVVFEGQRHLQPAHVSNAVLGLPGGGTLVEQELKLCFCDVAVDDAGAVVVEEVSPVGNAKKADVRLYLVPYLHNGINLPGFFYQHHSSHAMAQEHCQSSLGCIPSVRWVAFAQQYLGPSSHPQCRISPCFKMQEKPGK